MPGIFAQNFSYELNPDRRYYLYVVRGELTINGLSLVESDGLSFIEESLLEIDHVTESEIILFDLI
jgi:redox-sensitive bicupin YhaK (pirin superfamily)